ncbi:transcriptional regulator with XRE-family HTH domain [Nocardia transvalensis]|uniref:Transcriptional regulator with XRE-family HTH domain n=1 Tax=Nocardia transvalensis TaxID=37333 RepID=A0A7W9PEN0_9NOCA|nr:helix-turn-helix transcriptional regulator [Nocardia transvalensis]MBB5914771.1 transcriptional regulator with XRE-family HTH domain [Nocardia transvalensis]
MSENGSTLPRRQLGRYLRNGREECGLTLQQAAALIQRSASTLQRIERGMVVHVREVDIEALCKIYGFDDRQMAAMKALAVQGSELSWWCEYGDVMPENFDFYVGLEASAHRLFTYESELVPGLLQTPAYGSALMHAAHPEDTAEEHGRRVQLRMRRQMRITRKYEPATLDVVLRESAIHGMVGGPRVMAAQLKHLSDMGTRPNVSVRILPFSAGFPLGDPVESFVILEFGPDRAGQPIEPPVVYVEGLLGDLYLAKPRAVERYHQAYECLRRSALDPTASRTLLRRAAKEY